VPVPPEVAAGGVVGPREFVVDDWALGAVELSATRSAGGLDATPDAAVRLW